MNPHVLEINLNPEGWQFAQWAGSLSPSEKERAKRLRIPQRQRQFAAGRGRLREILGQYLNEDPAKIQFSYNTHGKPSLANPEQAWLKFNLAHSGDSAICVVAKNQDVGINIERIHPIQNISRLVKQFFSLVEWQRFCSLPAEQRQETFFTAWTRKEAYVKARGLSNASFFRDFDVSLLPNQPARLLEDRLHPQEMEKWTLRTLNVGEKYKAALVVREENTTNLPV